MQLTVFVAGRYGQLNGRPAAELIEGEKRKVLLFQDAVLLFGLQPANKESSVYPTDFLWSKKDYWKEVLRKKDMLGIIDTSREGRPFREVVASFEKELQAKIDDGAEPVVTPIEHPFVQRIIALAESFSDKRPSISPLMGGTLPLLGDLRRYVGVPGLSAPGNAGYWASGAHAPNEHVRLADIEQAVAFNCHMFWGLGE